MSASQTEALVKRFYEDLWNRWELAAGSEILAEDLSFRGSLGAQLQGREAFDGYVEGIRRAFPDWHNGIDELVALGNRAFVRLTWTGTHTGPLGTLEPTHRRVEYVGVGLFRVAAGLITEAWIVGDTHAFWKCLDLPGPLGPG
jgi:predicted ester cyclase